MSEKPTGWMNREVLAWTILGVSTIGIIIVSTAVLKEENGDPLTVFTGVIALFGTWVGTILAFYFSRENFESASASLQQVVKTLGPEEKLKQTPVRIAMIARSSITELPNGGRPDSAILLSEVCAQLGVKPRVPILNVDGSIRYIIHDSMVYKYITDETLAGRAINPAKVSLDAFLAHRIGTETLQAVVSKLAFVGVTGSLADAREKMVAVKGAKDVVVTKTGAATEGVEGWITDVDIARHAQVQ